GQIVADYAISTYFTSARGVTVNLYTPSELRFQRNGRAISLRQTTQYPLDSAVEIAVRAGTPQTFSVALRIPAWAGPATSVAVNGKRQASPKPGTLHEIRREWR